MASELSDEARAGLDDVRGAAIADAMSTGTGWLKLTHEGGGQMVIARVAPHLVSFSEATETPPKATPAPAKGILLAVPTRGSIQAETATRLTEIRDQAAELDPVFYCSGGMSVAITRNAILIYADRMGYEFVAMVDDDVVAPLGMLQWASKLAPADNGYGMIAFPFRLLTGAEPRHTIYKSVQISKQTTGWAFETVVPDGLLHEVDGIGTGVCILSMHAMRALPGWPTPFRFEQTADDVRGEDLLMCRDLKSAGFKIGYVQNPNDEADHLTKAWMNQSVISARHG